MVFELLFSAMDASGQVGTHLAYLGGGVAGPRGNCNLRGLSSTPPSRGQKGGPAVGPTKPGKGTKIIALADDHILPLAVSIESASPHESKLVEGVPRTQLSSITSRRD